MLNQGLAGAARGAPPQEPMPQEPMPQEQMPQEGGLEAKAESQGSDKAMKKAQKAVVKWMHGPARKTIVDRLQAAAKAGEDQLAPAVGEMIFPMIMKMSEQGDGGLGFEDWQNVAMIAIEGVLEMAEAMGIPGSDDEETREAAFFEIQAAYAKSAEQNPKMMKGVHERAEGLIDGGQMGAVEAYGQEMMGRKPVAAGVNAAIGQEQQP